MLNEICSLPQSYHAIIILIVMLFETWLGRTNKTKSGSLLELIFNLLLVLPKKLKKENKDDKTV